MGISFDLMVWRSSEFLGTKAFCRMFGRSRFGREILAKSYAPSLRFF